MPRKAPPRKQAGQPTGRRRFNGAEMDVAGQARELGITEKALRSQVARGVIPYRRHGGRIVFLPDEVRDFLRRLPGVTAEQALANVAARNGAAR
jgi:Helix-turn-helix domain